MNTISSPLEFQQTILGLRAHRQEVLAGNIANADTPTYKARDFDFATALQNAMVGRTSDDLPLAMTSPQHLSGVTKDTLPRLLYRTPIQMSADGNTVEMDTERQKFTENAMRYQAGIQFISGHMKTLMSAVQGQ